MIIRSTIRPTQSIAASSIFYICTWFKPSIIKLSLFLSKYLHGVFYIWNYFTCIWYAFSEPGRILVIVIYKKKKKMSNQNKKFFDKYLCSCSPMPSDIHTIYTTSCCTSSCYSRVRESESCPCDRAICVEGDRHNIPGWRELLASISSTQSRARVSQLKVIPSTRAVRFNIHLYHHYVNNLGETTNKLKVDRAFQNKVFGFFYNLYILTINVPWYHISKNSDMLPPLYLK